MSLYLEGVEDKYPAYLLDKRKECEGNVIACLFADPTLVEEFTLPENYFLTSDGRFYLFMVKELVAKGIINIDEVSIRTTLPEDMIEGFKDRGGYKTIQHLQRVIRLENWQAYYEEFTKKNLLNRLYLDGYNLEKPVKVNGQMVIPYKLFEHMNCDQITDFYDTQLASYQIGEQSMITEEGDLCFGDKWLERLDKGESIVREGSAYDVIGYDDDLAPVGSFGYLNERTLGFHHGKLACIGAFSGTGKTTIMVNMVMGLVNSGEKVLIISNEDSMEDMQTRIVCIIASKIFHYQGITRDSFKRNSFTERDKEILKKVWKRFDEDYGKNIFFVGTSETSPKFFRRKIKEYKLRYGCSAFWIDTLKLAEKDFKSERTDLALVMNSRELANLAKKYDMIGICSLQLAERHKGVLSVSSVQIGTAKQVKEIMQQLILIRQMYPPEELDPSKKKTYCHPFRLEERNGKIIEVEVHPRPEQSYLVVAIDKNRDGTCTPNDGISYLYQFNGKYSTFDEVCMVRTPQKTVDNARG